MTVTEMLNAAAQTAVVTGEEVGCALNAETFFEDARKAMHEGRYSDFLVCVDLAGQFARDARMAFYARKFR